MFTVCPVSALPCRVGVCWQMHSCHSCKAFSSHSQEWAHACAGRGCRAPAREVLQQAVQGRRSTQERRRRLVRGRAAVFRSAAQAVKQTRGQLGWRVRLRRGREQRRVALQPRSAGLPRRAPGAGRMPAARSSCQASGEHQDGVGRGGRSLAGGRRRRQARAAQLRVQRRQPRGRARCCRRRGPRPVVRPASSTRRVTRAGVAAGCAGRRARSHTEHTRLGRRQS